MDDSAGCRVLDIKMQNYVNTLQTTAYPLCIILSDEKYYPWFYENYISIFGRIHSNGWGWLDFTNAACYGENYFNNDLLESSQLGYSVIDHIKDINGFVIDNIDSGHYCIMFLDEYYPSGRPYYHKKHFIHELLLYGYDKTKREFDYIGFDIQNNFCKGNITFDDFSEAFEKGKLCERMPWIDENAIILIKLKKARAEYAFDFNRYLKNLEDYLSSNPNCHRMIYQNLFECIEGDETEADYRYGINSYDVLLRCLHTTLTCISKGIYPGNYYIFHHMYEHKKILYDSLQYMVSGHPAAPDISGQIANYREVVEEMDNLRMKYLKYYLLHVEDDFKSTTNQKFNPASIKSMIEKIKSIKEKERSILSEIVGRMKGEYLV